MLAQESTAEWVVPVPAITELTQAMRCWLDGQTSNAAHGSSKPRDVLPASPNSIGRGSIVVERTLVRSELDASERERHTKRTSTVAVATEFFREEVASEQHLIW
ncbi:hypothetical protein ON010_g15421 [Phytophthora cinnamomi]|nr:hypothetical protein ON010_g15421 [Phytophthora cinnamomi]